MESISKMEPLRLKFGFQHYAWGKLGRDSIMASLGLIRDEHFDLPVSEAWAGAHPALPSVAEFENGERDLLSLIADHPEEILGKRVLNTFGHRLPFLLKLLSVGIPISIQVHPDQKTAQLLHQRHPEKYREPHHKPEVGVALTETALLFGFRSKKEIEGYLNSYGPLAHLVKVNPKLADEDYVRTVFSRVLQSQDDERLEASDSLCELLKVKKTLTPEETYFLYLQELFPGDAGTFQVFILNLVSLFPGQAILISPNTPHAYLSGDILECMAASDFVIRAGLTPKPKDVASLIETVSYESIIPSPAKTDLDKKSNFDCFCTDFNDFRLERLNGATDEIFNGPDSPTLYFALSGSGVINAGNNIQIKAPELVLVPASAGTHRVNFEGELYRVTVP